MLNGLSPIIIFVFKKLLPSTQSTVTYNGNSVPVLAESSIPAIPYLPIPIYLDEKLTGIYIESESKNIDISTTVQTSPETATDPTAKQNGVNSTITVNMIASKTSIGLSILMGMSDIIFSLVTTGEYGITYLHDGIAIFDGLLEGFSVTQNSNDDLYNIALTLSNAKAAKTIAKASPTPVAAVSGALPL
jgi:hypothetical protein